MAITSGTIRSISVGKKRGTKKENIPRAILKEDYGIVGDVHAGTQRQLSLLAEESIDKMRQKGLMLSPGDFAENITTKGIDLMSLEIGSKLRMGDTALLEITHIGKICHDKCSIYYQVGDCVMPREGVFASVLKGGTIKLKDKLEVVENAKRATRGGIQSSGIDDKR